MRSPGFTLSLPEYGETIETLWQTVRGAYHFVQERKRIVLTLTPHRIHEPESRPHCTEQWVRIYL